MSGDHLDLSAIATLARAASLAKHNADADRRNLATGPPPRHEQGKRERARRRRQLAKQATQ
jgi:hypothetical protein